MLRSRAAMMTHPSSRYTERTPNSRPAIIMCRRISPVSCSVRPFTRLPTSARVAGSVPASAAATKQRSPTCRRSARPHAQPQQ
jgi:hypothetical protein